MRFTVVALVLAACTADPAIPTPTQARCPDPDPNTLTWDSFAQPFFTTYCMMCHSATLSHEQRNGAPLYHDFDSLMTTLRFPDHIDEFAGSGPAATNTIMPPQRCPSTPGGSLDRDCARPSDAERMNLSVWLACEVNRPHPF